MPRAIMLAVVSWPASSISTAISVASCLVSSPALIRLVSPESMSSPGLVNRSSTRMLRYSNIAPAAAIRCSGVDSWWRIALLLSWNRSWSAYGTPSSSQITSDGTGRANSAIRSTGCGPASM